LRVPNDLFRLLTRKSVLLLGSNCVLWFPVNTKHYELKNAVQIYVNVITFNYERGSSAASTMDRNSTIRGSGSTWKSNQNHNNSSRSPSRTWQRPDDEEHGLIARYAAKLAEANNSSAEPVETGSSTPHQLLAQLEIKNQEILRQIARIRYLVFNHCRGICSLFVDVIFNLMLRREQEYGDSLVNGTNGPIPLVEELTVLRQRKTELEQQLTALQDSRKQLMIQLEGLMKMIKVPLLILCFS